MVNVYVSAAVLGLAGAAAAAAGGPKYPETSVRKGFRLVVNVTDPSGAFKSIHNTYVSIAHDGNPGEEALSTVKELNNGFIFYLNGSHTDHYNNQVLTGYSPNFAGIVFDKNKEDPQPNPRTARLVPRRGDDYFSLIHYGEHLPYLRPDTWIACNEKFQRNQRGEKSYVAFKQIAVVFNPRTNHYDLNVPNECTIVRLLPECADLKELPKESTNTHSNVIDAHCYQDVKSIEWSKYASE